MTKIELDARYEDARKLSECFLNVKTPSDSELIGTFRGRFIVMTHQRTSFDYERMIIDLTTCQPNIYKLMEHGFNISATISSGDYNYSYTLEYDFSELEDKCDALELLKQDKIQSIRILDMDKMNGVTEIPK